MARSKDRSEAHRRPGHSPSSGVKDPQKTAVTPREDLRKLTAKRRIGHMLLDAGLISKTQFDRAVAVQAEKGGEIIDILFSLAYIDSNTFLDFLLTYPGIVPADLAHFEIRPDLIEILPADLAQEHQVVPIDRDRGVLTLGTVSLLNAEAIRELEAATGLTVKPLLCQPEDVLGALARYYPVSTPDESGQPGATASTAEIAGEQARRSIEGLHQPIRLSHVAHLIRQISSLPALPETVSQVREAMHTPSSSIGPIVDIITLDPPIAAKVLSVANSAAYGFAHRIHDLTLAVSLLGLRETYVVVLSAAVVDLLNKWKNFDYRAFWLDSMYCAAASRIVAKAGKRRALVGVFSAGLLHDIGRAALWEVVPQLCAKLDPHLAGRDLVAEEERIIGLSHSEAGHELAEHWNLPVELDEAVRFHHTPWKASLAREHAVIVAVANTMVRAVGSTLEENAGIFDGHEESLAFLGIDPETAEAMLEEYIERRESALRDAFE